MILDQSQGGEFSANGLIDKFGVENKLKPLQWVPCPCTAEPALSSDPRPPLCAVTVHGRLAFEDPWGREIRVGSAMLANCIDLRERVSKWQFEYGECMARQVSRDLRSPTCESL